MLFIINLSTFERLYCDATLSRQPLMKKMMNDAFAKDNNENSLHSFLFFLSRLNLTRRLMPYFRPCCHLVNRLRWVSAMSFIYRQMMNTTLYYWSQALFLSVIMTNDSIYLHRLRHRSWVWLTAMALPIMSPRDRNTFARRNGLYR